MRHLQRINNWSPSEIGGMELLNLGCLNTYAEEVYRVLPPHIDVQTAEQRYQVSLIGLQYLTLMC